MFLSGYYTDLLLTKPNFLHCLLTRKPHIINNVINIVI